MSGSCVIELHSSRPFWGLLVGYASRAIGEGTNESFQALDRSKFADPSDLGCFQPSFNRVGQGAASLCFGADGHMADASSRHILFTQDESALNLKAAGIQPLRAQVHAQLIAAMHGSEKVRVAVHHRQGNLWPAFLAAAAGEY